MIFNKVDFYAKHDPQVLKILEKSVIGIAGCGGLGSNAAVALARSGIGKLILTDFDKIELTNLNRQYFFTDQIGQYKAEALADNIKRINPFVQLDVFTQKIDSGNISNIFDCCDILIEAFDRADQKIMLIEGWISAYHHKPIICGSGVYGIGGNNNIHTRQIDQIWICGDEVSELPEGLTPLAPKVSLIANMQANLALELLLKIYEVKTC